MAALEVAQVAGLAAVAAGVLLLAGVGWALIAAGVLVVAFTAASER